MGLLNVLEERDVQIRGYKIRLPLDVMLFASANPEDYTNRGRIITPLKDRFGAQIRTHYPLEVETEVAIARQEARPLEADGIRVVVPDYMADVVAQLSHLARQSPHINQRSGVSVRLTVSNLETLVANAMRRALVHGETDVVPRVSDLEALASSTAGKVEIESIDEGRDEQVVEHLLKAAILTTFRDSLSIEDLRAVVDAFEGSRVVHAGEDVGSADYVALVRGDEGAARTGAAPDGWRRVRRLGRERGRVPARRPPPVEATQQGVGRRPRAVPRARLMPRGRRGPSCRRDASTLLDEIDCAAALKALISLVGSVDETATVASIATVWIWQVRSRTGISRCTSRCACGLARLGPRQRMPLSRLGAFTRTSCLRRIGSHGTVPGWTTGGRSPPRTRTQLGRRWMLVLGWSLRDEDDGRAVGPTASCRGQRGRVGAPNARLSRRGRSLVVGAMDVDGDGRCGYVPALSCWDPAAALCWATEPSDRITGGLVMVATRFSFSGLWHWIFEGLVPLVRLDDAGVLPKVDRVMICADERLGPVVQESLEAMHLGAQYELVTESFDLSVDLLVMPVRPPAQGGIVDPTHQLRLLAFRSGTADGIRLVRERLGISTQPLSDAGRRLFVSRSDAPKRRVANESELLDVLRPFGFERVVPGELSFEEQVEAFRSASVLVGPHGAGLANIIFSQPGTGLLELQHQDVERNFYRGVAEVAGLRHAEVSCRPDPASPMDMVADPDEIVASCRG